jgi:ligand-binding sensor domain-containing protein
VYECSLDQIRRACGKQQDKDELLTFNKTRSATSSAKQHAVRGEGRMQVAEGVTICAASTRELQSPQALQEDEDEDEDEVQPHRANNSTHETDKILEPGG